MSVTLFGTCLHYLTLLSTANIQIAFLEKKKKYLLHNHYAVNNKWIFWSFSSSFQVENQFIFNWQLVDYYNSKYNFTKNVCSFNRWWSPKLFIANHILNTFLLSNPASFMLRRRQYFLRKKIRILRVKLWNKTFKKIPTLWN